MHYLLLENPSAGRGGGRELLDALVAALAAAGHHVSRHCGEHPGDLARHVATLTPDAIDILLVAGGDGTLRSVLNARTEPPPWPIGVLPFGTANLVARETGTFPFRDPEHAARTILAAEPWAVDLLEVRRGSADPEWAITTVSAGLDGAVVHAVARLRGEAQASGGYLRWIAPLLSTFRVSPYPTLEVSVDGGPPLACMTAVAQNAHCYGGLFVLAPEAHLDTRCLQVVTFHAHALRDLVRLALKAGLRSVHRDRQVRVLEGERVTFRAPAPREVQIDGDAGGFTDLEIRLRPAALRLLRAL